MLSALANLTNVTHSSHYQIEKMRMQNRESRTGGKGERRGKPEIETLLHYNLENQIQKSENRLPLHAMS